MTEGWLYNVTQILAQGGLGTVLCLGRTGRDLLAALPPEAAQHIVVLEHDPTQRMALRRQHGATITLLEAGFSQTDQPATLHRFNMSVCDALRPATGLLQLLPGLRETATDTIKTVSAATVLKQTPLKSATAPHVLVLGAAGEEMSALSQFDDHGALARFTHILTPLPSQPLYEGAADGAGLLERLENAGFRVATQDISDPDRPLAWLRRDAAWMGLTAERDALQTELKEHMRTTEALSEVYDTLSKNLETAKPTSDTPPEGTASVQASLRTAELDAEMTRLTAQLHILQSLSAFEAM